MLTPQDREQLERLIPALSGLTNGLGRRVTAESSPIKIDGGTEAFDVGDPCVGLVLLFSGNIRVSQGSAEGRELFLYDVRPGDICILSVACLLGGEGFTARGVVTEDARGVLIPKGLFRDLVDGVPVFRTLVFSGLGRQVTHLMRLIEEVAFQRLDRRLAHLLLSHAHSEFAEPIALTHQEIADRLGTAREIVSRVLGSFEMQGLVELGRRRIRIRDLGSLSSLAGTEAT